MLQGGGDAPALGRYCTSRPRPAHLPSTPTRTTFSRTCCISSSNRLRPGHHEGYPSPSRLCTALSATRAAAAPAPLPDAQLPRPRLSRRRCRSGRSARPYTSVMAEEDTVLEEAMDNLEEAGQRVRATQSLMRSEGMTEGENHRDLLLPASLRRSP